MSIAAFLLVLVSTFMHAGWNFFIKKSYPTSETYMIAVTTGVLSLVPVGLMYMDFFRCIPIEVWWLIFWTGFFQAIYLSGLAAAYRYGDFSIAYPVARSSPVFVVMVMTVLLGRGDEISLQAIVGIFIIVGSAFFLPMKNWGDLKLRNYFNIMSAFALVAAIGTTGYSIVDDQALRILRMPDVLGGELSVLAISFLYLFFDAAATLFWMLVCYGLYGWIWVRRKGRKTGGWKGPRKFLFPILMGLMIYMTYGLVLVSMAYASNVSYIVAFRQLSLPIGVILGLIVLKEEGSWVRFCAVSTMVFGLVLVGTG